MENSLKKIASIKTDFPTKFGIPRQSGLVEMLEGRIIFEPEFRKEEAVRGLEQFSHIWLLWGFSESEKENWSATVRPPRLGGNKRIGVFATRSPFRPNKIGLSCVRLERMEKDKNLGIILVVMGADLMDGTPIYDIKPYIPVADCHKEAWEGYTEKTKEYQLQVNFPEELLIKLPPNKREVILEVLAQDPRPAYINDTERVYGMVFAGYNIKFKVEGGVLQVCKVEQQF
mgnify:FL=1